MKGILLLVLAVGLGALLRADDPSANDPAQLRKEIARVRHSTNWDDPVQREQTKAKIQELADQLAKALKKPAAGPAGAPAAASGDTGSSSAPGEPLADDEGPLMKMWKSGLKSMNESHGADIRLDTQIRDEMEQQYRADQDRSFKNPEAIKELDTLVLDLSLPESQALVRQMEQFKSIRTLIVTGGTHGAPVDLPAIIGKARDYPLRRLYIIYFRQYVTELPDLERFTGLSELGLFGNQLGELPASVGQLSHLQSLYVDANPLPTIVGLLHSLPELSRLGIEGTKISAAERREIQQLLPNCQLVTQ